MDWTELLELAWCLAFASAFTGAVLSGANVWQYDNDPDAQPFHAPLWRRRAWMFLVLTIATVPLAFLLPWRS